MAPSPTIGNVVDDGANRNPIVEVESLVDANNGDGINSPVTNTTLLQDGEVSSTNGSKLVESEIDNTGAIAITDTVKPETDLVLNDKDKKNDTEIVLEVEIVCDNENLNSKNEEAILPTLPEEEESPSTSQPSPPPLPSEAITLEEPSNLVDTALIQNDPCLSDDSNLWKASDVQNEQSSKELPFPEGNSIDLDLGKEEELRELVDFILPDITDDDGAADVLSPLVEKDGEGETKALDDIPDLHNESLPFRYCKIVVRRCDDISPTSSSSKEGWSRIGDQLVYHDKISNSELNTLEKKLNIIKAANASSDEESDDIEDYFEVIPTSSKKKGRPPKKKRLNLKGKSSTQAKKGEIKKASVHNNKELDRQSESADVPEMAKKSPKQNKNEIRKSSEPLSAAVTTDNSGKDGEEEDMDLLLSAFESCPSPDISDIDLDIADVILSNEAAIQSVQAWVDVGENDEKVMTESRPVTTEPEPDHAADHTSDEEDDGATKSATGEEFKPSLKCSECSKTFDNPLTLQVHMRLHTGERPYKCKCGEAFIHYTYLEYHMKNSHGGKSPFKSAGNFDGNEEPVKRRMNAKQSKGRGRGINKKQARKLKQDTNGSNTDTVQPSGSTSVSKARKGTQFLKQRGPNRKSQGFHTPNTGNEPEEKVAVASYTGSYVCPYCMKIFQYPSLLIIHLKTHSGDTPYKCFHCDQAFKQSRQLEKHVKEVHSRDISTFHTNNDAKGNIQVEGSLQFSPTRKLPNLSSRRIKSNKSSKAVRYQNVISEHVDSDDGFVKVKKYTCSYCGIHFDHPSRIKAHLLIHTGERRFRCGECPMRFRHKWNMQKHIQRVHQQGRTCRFKCPECSGGFDNKGSLHKHLKGAHQITTADSIPPISNIGIHTGEGERPYCCGECPMRFRHNWSMQRHFQLVHQQGRACRFKCPECSGGFKNKGNLGKHLKDAHQITAKNKLSISNIGANVLAKIRKRKRKSFYFTNKRPQRTIATSTSNMNQATPKQDPYSCYVKLVRCDNLVQKHTGSEKNYQVPANDKVKEDRKKANMRRRCIYCKRNLSSNYSLRRHMLIVHKVHSNNSTLETGILSTVERVEKVRPAASNRITTTTPRVPHIRKLGRPTLASLRNNAFKCPKCDKRFKAKTSLKFHMAIHTGEKRYECNYCMKPFALQNSRNSHRYNCLKNPKWAVNNLKPIECTECDKKFKRRRTMEQHMILHAVENKLAIKSDQNTDVQISTRNDFQQNN